jgi:methenyltetrahydrofolate cyclohydrolase
MAKKPDVPMSISLRDFIAAVGSAEEAHGAVSTAAVAGGLGTALLLMAATLPQTRSEIGADRAKLIDAATALSDLQQQLIETIETETVVKLFAAGNMPEASDAQRSARRAALQLALRASADVPLEVMRLCTRGLKLAATVARHCARALSADAGLGVTLLRAGFDGARANLEGKLSSFTDPVYVTSVVDEIARLSDEATAAARAAASSLEVLPA